jgi:N-acetyltransferase
MRMNWLEPVTLEGTLVRLEPITIDHAAPMFEHFESRAMTFLPSGHEIATLEEFVAYIQKAIDNPACQYWAVRMLETDQVAGFMLYKLGDCWLAIGTLLMPTFWGSGANTEAKFLLMTRAFEVLDVPRVQFTVEAENARSVAALEKFALQEAILRKYFAGKDIAIYSVIRDEWLDAKRKLEEQIAKGTRV